MAALRTAPHPLHLAGDPVASEQSFSVLNPATAEPAAEVGDAGAEAIATAIGLYQIWSAQFQEISKPRHYLICGQAGPLGWEVPACLGAKLGRPEATVVGVVGDYSFEFLMEEVAAACQFDVPYVLVMLNNAYLGLIRQAERKYDMNFGVDIAYDESYGMDHVKVMEAMGAFGRRVTTPDEIRDALAWAVETSERERRPALVEVLIDREADAAMGTSIDEIKETDPAEVPATTGV